MVRPALRVGVLALQGGVREHLEVLRSLGAAAVPARRAADLVGLDALVLPGGESTTIDRLLGIVGLREPVRRAILAGTPTLGTCAGLILLAREIVDPAVGQGTLDVLDITVERNAFGPQVDSAEERLETALGPVTAAFIRAPRVTRVGDGVEVLARRGGEVVAVGAGDVIALAFHPELTGDPTFHRALLRSAERRAAA